MFFCFNTDELSTISIFIGLLSNSTSLYLLIARFASLFLVKITCPVPFDLPFGKKLIEVDLTGPISLNKSYILN